MSKSSPSDAIKKQKNDKSKVLKSLAKDGSECKELQATSLSQKDFKSKQQNCCLQKPSSSKKNKKKSEKSSSNVACHAGNKHNVCSSCYHTVSNPQAINGYVLPPASSDDVTDDVTAAGYIAECSESEVAILNTCNENLSKSCATSETDCIKDNAQKEFSCVRNTNKRRESLLKDNIMTGVAEDSFTDIKNNDKNGNLSLLLGNESGNSSSSNKNSECDSAIEDIHTEDIAKKSSQIEHFSSFCTSKDHSGILFSNSQKCVNESNKKHTLIKESSFPSSSSSCTSFQEERLMALNNIKQRLCKSTVSLGSLTNDKARKANVLPHANSVPDRLSKLRNHVHLLPIRSQSLLPSLSDELDILSLQTTNGSNLTVRKQSFQKTDSLSFLKSLDAISSISSQTSSILIPITTKAARTRSYLVGSVCSSGSLLGAEELTRYFPDKKMTVYVGTWNMNGQCPPENLDDFLLPEGINYLPDIFAIGVQEGFQDKREWEIIMQTALGPSHVLFHSATLGVLHLALFLRRDLIWFCSRPEDASVTTRPGSVVKTKGAVGICFMFFGTSLLFINSHLTAHERKLRERLADYEKICTQMDLPKLFPLKPQYQNKDVTSRFDCVFWCGDLNFRLVHDRSLVMSFVEERLRNMLPSFDVLLEYDQLQQAMCEGAVFSGFQEGQIAFGPSYKYKIGTSSFDTVKQRVPSYTDRVLFRAKYSNSVQCLHYDMVPTILTSDHKPVFALMEVKVRPGRDNISLAAGLFNREVYLEANRRRAMALEIQANEKSSLICAIM